MATSVWCSFGTGIPVPLHGFWPGSRDTDPQGCRGFTPAGAGVAARANIQFWKQQCWEEVAVSGAAHLHP